MVIICEYQDNNTRIYKQSKILDKCINIGYMYPVLDKCTYIQPPTPLKLEQSHWKSPFPSKSLLPFSISLWNFISSVADTKERTGIRRLLPEGIGSGVRYCPQIHTQSPHPIPPPTHPVAPLPPGFFLPSPSLSLPILPVLVGPSVCFMAAFNFII